MNTVDWNLITQTLNPNDSYSIFIEKFIKIYDQAFPLQKIKIKGKSLVSPWIIKVIKFLKHKTTKTLETNKNYKNLFEKFKKIYKKHYYQNKLEKCKNNLKTTWKTMKEIIGKSKVFHQNLPNNLRLNKTSITDIKIIVDKFNEFFINIGSNLAAKIPPSKMNFDSYLPHVCTTFADKSVTEEELKRAFFSLKPNKNPGYDNINVNVVKKISEELKTPLMRIFNLSLSTGIFPDKLKIAKVSPIFKNGKNYLLTNYRLISLLPCFLKVLEHIMCDRLYSYLTENILLFKKQFGFRSGHSTDHALLELIDQICECFHEKEYFLGIFVDLSKAFDTINHQILINKLENYGIYGKKLLWFESYLSNRKQYLKYKDNFNEQKSTNLLQIKCGVPQGSILGPLLFLIYINDLSLLSKFLSPIMFADDSNLFYSHNNIKTLIKNANDELEKISQWFKTNKLSLNEGKTKFVLFHKPCDKDNLPLQLPNLKINNNEIKRSSSIKFLGVLADENLTWIDHITLVKNKLSKNLGLLHKAKNYLNKKSMVSLYYSFIHSYLNYGNITWCSTSMRKLKKTFI